MTSGWGEATIGSSSTGLGLSDSLGLSSANVLRQLSKVGVVVGAEGLEAV